MAKRVRCFVAIDIPNSLRSKLVEIQNFLKSLGVSAKWVEPENFHITIAFLMYKKEPGVPEELLDDVKKVLDKVSEKPFEMYIKGFLPIPSENFIRVLALDVRDNGEFFRIQGFIVNELKKIGIESSAHPPHLTLGRVKILINRKGFLEKIKENKDIFDVGRFTVDKISLKKSTLTPQGPIYEDLYVKHLY